jgi:phosphatidylglycerophosphatase A
MRKAVLLVATGAGSGYSPYVPGTVGSGVGLLLYALILSLPLSGHVLTGVLSAVALLTALAGTWAAGSAEALFGRKDDRRITIDEIAGMLIALVALPVRPEAAASAFLIFRLLDVVKPPPARAAERLPGGVGVMADDLVAGAYANVMGQVLWRVLLPGASA